MSANTKELLRTLQAKQLELSSLQDEQSRVKSNLPPINHQNVAKRDYAMWQLDQITEKITSLEAEISKLKGELSERGIRI